jgi:hypothetical protein
MRCERTDDTYFPIWVRMSVPISGVVMLGFCPVAEVCTCRYHNDLKQVDEANGGGF